MKHRHSVCHRVIAILMIGILTNALTLYAELPEYTVTPESTLPAVDSGSCMRLIVASEALDDRMTVDIWFPPTYEEGVTEGFPVVYVHDGQNLFDPALSFSNVAWELDKTATFLTEQVDISAPIIVGIHNRGSKNLRPNDYFPEKAIDYIDDPEHDASLIWDTCADGFYGNEHAAFVATELKPLIDHLFNTASDRAHTFTMGSSMGALASLYLLCEYPDTFGGAACLSTHWIGAFKMNADYTLQPDPLCAEAILDYVNDRLTDPIAHKLYLDQGTTGWDADYQPYESKVRTIAGEQGYDERNGSLMTFDAIGAGHNEWYWQQRVDRPLKFLLGNRSTDINNVTIDITDPASPLYDLNGIPVTNPPAPGIYIRNRSKILIK